MPYGPKGRGEIATTASGGSVCGTVGLRVDCSNPFEELQDNRNRINEMCHYHHKGKWHTPLSPALWRQGQVDLYLSLRFAWPAERVSSQSVEPCLKTNKNTQMRG